MNAFLGPNVTYLRKIGRLPEEFKGLYPRKDFALPKKKKAVVK